MSAKRIAKLEDHLRANPTNSLSAYGKKILDDFHAIKKSVQRGDKNYEFAYTVNDDGLLTREQQEFFEENGYLVIPGLLSEEKIDRYNAHFRDLAAHPEKRKKSMNVVVDVTVAKNKTINRNNEETITKFQEFLEDEI